MEKQCVIIMNTGGGSVGDEDAEEGIREASSPGSFGAA
jgi:hypothetical protein